MESRGRDGQRVMGGDGPLKVTEEHGRDEDEKESEVRGKRLESRGRDGQRVMGGDGPLKVTEGHGKDEDEKESEARGKRSNVGRG